MINPWHPMTDAVDLKHIGKLAEDACELGAAASRCAIQGIDEAEPATGKLNRHWLEDEIADVEANIALVKERFKLDRARICSRKTSKMLGLREWHELA